MPLKWIFTLFVCSSYLDLPYSFVLSGQDILCIDNRHRCHVGSGGNDQSCEIQNENGYLIGRCINQTNDHPCHSDTVLPHDGDYCICQTQSCVDKVSAQHYALIIAQRTFQCLGQTCDSGNCAIRTDENNQLYSDCHSMMTLLPCSDYKTPDRIGCFCSSAQCVNMTVSSFTMTTVPTSLRIPTV